MPRVNNIKNAATETVSGWHFDLDYGTWNFGHMVVGDKRPSAIRDQPKGPAKSVGPFWLIPLTT